MDRRQRTWNHLSSRHCKNSSTRDSRSYRGRKRRRFFILHEKLKTSPRDSTISPTARYFKNIPRATRIYRYLDTGYRAIEGVDDLEISSRGEKSSDWRKKWAVMRITRGSNFHDEEQQLRAQSGVKQGSLKRRGSGFVSTATPLPSSLLSRPYPRVLEKSLFSMTIEFRCAKVRREVEKSILIESSSSSFSLAEESRDSARLSSLFSSLRPSLPRWIGRARCFPKIPRFSARSAQGKRSALFLDERHSRKPGRSIEAPPSPPPSSSR